LDCMNCEIFPQEWHENFGTDQREVIQMTLKKLFVSEYRDTVCTGLMKEQSGPYRIKVLSDNSSRGRRLLDFADKPKIFRYQRFAEASKWSKQACPGAPVLGMRQPWRDLFLLMSDNFCKAAHLKMILAQARQTDIVCLVFSGAKRPTEPTRSAEPAAMGVSACRRVGVWAYRRPAEAVDETP